jgi:hypothetical protein
VLLPALMYFGIKNNNLSYFILNTAINNDITLIKFAKLIDFNLFEQRLRYISHILNLIVKQYLFG